MWAFPGIQHKHLCGLCSFVWSCSSHDRASGIRTQGAKERCYPQTSGLGCKWKKMIGDENMESCGVIEDKICDLNRATMTRAYHIIYER